MIIEPRLPYDMDHRPLLYDTYCGAGGATRGYMDAGFRVIGIDNKLQPRYCGDGFIQMDALEFLERLVRGEYEQPGAIHASPPCQAFSAMQRANVMRKDHPDLIDPTRQALRDTGKPWIIENVPGVPLRNYIILCGQFFALRVLRHRWFESELLLPQPPHITHQKQAKIRGHHDPTSLLQQAHIGFTTGSVMRAFTDAMDCRWMKPDEGRQAIPPAYTEFVGKQLMAVVEAK